VFYNLKDIHIHFFGIRTDFRKSRFINEGQLTAPPTNLRTLSTNTTSQLNILGHDCNTLSMNSAQVGILEQTDEVRLGRLLKSQHRRPLKPQIALEILGDLPHQPLEGEFANEKVRGFLVPTDFAEGDGSGAVAVGFFDASRGRGGFAGGLGGELFAGGFASGGFTGGLFGTGHGWMLLLSICKCRFCEVV
jgi:hypothetical protein